MVPGDPVTQKLLFLYFEYRIMQRRTVKGGGRISEAQREIGSCVTQLCPCVTSQVPWGPHSTEGGDKGPQGIMAEKLISARRAPRDSPYRGQAKSGHQWTVGGGSKQSRGLHSFKNSEESSVIYGERSSRQQSKRRKMQLNEGRINNITFINITWMEVDVKA